MTDADLAERRRAYYVWDKNNCSRCLLHADCDIEMEALLDFFGDFARRWEHPDNQAPCPLKVERAAERYQDE
jgi:hypothetical protein